MSLFLKKKAEKVLDPNNIPHHIAIIMDGNGRWAKKRGLPRKMGHREGGKVFEEIVQAAGDLGVKVLTVYAFSTENWARPQDEVDALMELLNDYLNNGLRKLEGKNTRVRIVGDITALSKEMQDGIAHVEAETAHNTAMQVNIALNYGGRQEILHAAQKAAEMVAEGKLKPHEITESTFSSLLYFDCPDPDLIIRPSGELRLSNFLLWQGAYSELWFDHVLWPDFKKEHLIHAIYEYQQRNRRFGGI